MVTTVVIGRQRDFLGFLSFVGEGLAPLTCLSLLDFMSSLLLLACAYKSCLHLPRLLSCPLGRSL